MCSRKRSEAQAQAKSLPEHPLQRQRYSHSHSQSRIPLQIVSNPSSFLNSSDHTFSKRRKLDLQNPKSMAAIIKTVYTDTNTQIDELTRMKYEKLNELDKIKSQTWKLQSQIPDLELKLDKVRSEMERVKSKFNFIERQIIGLNSLKSQKVESLKKSISIFKNTMKEKFDDKVNSLNVKYEEKITKIIQDGIESFKAKEKKLKDEIKDLKDELGSYSSDVLQIDKKKLDKELRQELDNYTKTENIDDRRIKSECNELTLKIEDLFVDIKTLHDKYETQTQSKLESLKTISNDLLIQHEEIQIQERALNSKMNELNTTKDGECNKLLKLKGQCRQYKQDIESFHEQVKKEEHYRRFLHNQLQEMKGNIRVFCRLKPEPKHQNEMFNYQIRSMLDTSNFKETLLITEPKTANSNGNKSRVLKQAKTYTFSFDKVFDENATNGDIFEEISQLVQSSLDGFNVCIFTYGQTGSGKTFTMSNSIDGLIPSSIKLMFERLNTLNFIDKHYHLYGQFFEIYGDDTNDLIEDGFLHINNNDELVGLDNDRLENIKMIKLYSTEQIEGLLKHASEKRATASTMANDVSSRSHSIFKVYIISYNETLQKYENIGILNLVDLAGSERLSHSQVSGIRLKETLAINKSLSALGDVIANLKGKSSHIPYRNSKLTHVLKDSLGGDSKTLMFVNISCLNSHFNESLSSLRFASKVNNTVLRK
ncbi:unnamed protein product [Pichia kudriavzevii]